jgi:hypothetical protein
MRYLIFAAGLVMAGCNADEKAGLGKDTYISLCVACHGQSAKGDGPQAEDLLVRPADMTQFSAQNGGVFPYSDVMAQVYGYPRQFHVMPRLGLLLEGPKVMWQDENGVVVETP